MVISYWNALKNQGAPPAEIHTYPDGRHGFGTCEYYPGLNASACEWPKRAERWLARQLSLQGAEAEVALAPDEEPSRCPPAAASEEARQCSMTRACAIHCGAACWARCKAQR